MSEDLRDYTGALERMVLLHRNNPNRLNAKLRSIMNPVRFLRENCTFALHSARQSGTTTALRNMLAAKRFGDAKILFNSHDLRSSELFCRQYGVTIFDSETFLDDILLPEANVVAIFTEYDLICPNLNRLNHLQKFYSEAAWKAVENVQIVILSS